MDQNFFPVEIILEIINYLKRIQAASNIFTYCYKCMDTHLNASYTPERIIYDVKTIKSLRETCSAFAFPVVFIVSLPGVSFMRSLHYDVMSNGRIFGEIWYIFPARPNHPAYRKNNVTYSINKRPKQCQKRYDGYDDYIPLNFNTYSSIPYLMRAEINSSRRELVNDYETIRETFWHIGVDHGESVGLYKNLRMQEAQLGEIINYGMRVATTSSMMDFDLFPLHHRGTGKCLAAAAAADQYRDSKNLIGNRNQRKTKRMQKEDKYRRNQQWRKTKNTYPVKKMGFKNYHR